MTALGHTLGHDGGRFEPVPGENYSLRCRGQATSEAREVVYEIFVEEIAPARTFTFLNEVERLRQQGLALGGSLENAIVIGDTGILNNALRFDDEFVRHKILDVIGDMALIGHPMIGHLVAHRGGHALHTAFAAQVLAQTDAWTLVDGVPETVDTPRTVPAVARVS